MADFVRQDSCFDGGGAWSRERQVCRILPGGERNLPKWMVRYAVVEPDPDPSGELALNGVDEHRRDAPSNAQ
jgi:hypothetical protein